MLFPQQFHHLTKISAKFCGLNTGHIKNQSQRPVAQLQRAEDSYFFECALRVETVKGMATKLSQNPERKI